MHLLKSGIHINFFVSRSDFSLLWIWFYNLHCPKSNPNFRDISWNVVENMILHEIFRVVSRFPLYISCYIAENRLLYLCDSVDPDPKIQWQFLVFKLLLIKNVLLFYIKCETELIWLTKYILVKLFFSSFFHNLKWSKTMSDQNWCKQKLWLLGIRIGNPNSSYHVLINATARQPSSTGPPSTAHSVLV